MSKADFYEWKRYESSRGYDTDSDCNEGIESSGNSGNEGSNDIQDDDASTIKEHYEAEHRKLLKRNTMRPNTGVNEPNLSGCHKDEQQATASSAPPRPSIPPTGTLGSKECYKTFTTEFVNLKSPEENRTALDDLIGHGTTVAYQLTRTYPSADIYIAKVTVAESAD
ncbi:hypothetical protein F4859DRAFT_519802 [Xylaria cf. heliscus]|nr:hypothetical protein F4859DRAFT_519802 [Xylaria cf. heliscus]